MYKETLSFLKDLAKNNNKAWFDANRNRYDVVRAHFVEIVEETIGELAKYDRNFKGITAKDCVFGLNNDVRFSKDKSPYKLSFSAFIAKGGRKSIYPGYYFHIQPGNQTTIGGGMYLPEPNQLLKIRKEINTNGKKLDKIISAPKFKKLFPKIEGDHLVNVPKGFIPEHKYAHLLKQKSFIVMHKVSDKDVHTGKFMDSLCNGFDTMMPFNKFLSEAIA